MTHQIDQLKEEIQQKDHSLATEHFAHSKIQKEDEKHKAEVERLKIENEKTNHLATTHSNEIGKLR
jgi:hypothetical protein